jgi:hypothetical protein
MMATAKLTMLGWPAAAVKALLRALYMPRNAKTGEIIEDGPLFISGSLVYREVLGCHKDNPFSEQQGGGGGGERQGGGEMEMERGSR